MRHPSRPQDPVRDTEGLFCDTVPSRHTECRPLTAASEGGRLCKRQLGDDDLVQDRSGEGGKQ